MNQIHRVNKIIKVQSKFDLVKFQLVMYKFVEEQRLSDSEINALSYLVVNGYNKDSLREIVHRGYFKTEQSVRNCVRRAIDMGLLCDREDSYKVNPSSSICTSDQALIEVRVHNILHETKG